MCVAAFAWKTHPRYRLLFVGNRDEFHARPTAAADWWDSPPDGPDSPDSPDRPDRPGRRDIYAGRDLQAGGTWLGVTRQARFATVTNFRSPSEMNQTDFESRGALVVDALTAEPSLADWLEALAGSAQNYAGFNLVVGDRDQLFYAGNRATDGFAQSLPPGIHGVSNGQLNSDWPKLQKLRTALAGIAPYEADVEQLMSVLADRSVPAAESLPDTGVGIELERLVAPVFVCSPTYGTRASTVLMIDHDDQARMIERRFDAAGLMVGETDQQFRLDSADREH